MRSHAHTLTLKLRQPPAAAATDAAPPPSALSPPSLSLSFWHTHNSYSCGNHLLPFLTPNDVEAAKSINERMAAALAAGPCRA